MNEQRPFPNRGNKSRRRPLMRALIICIVASWSHAKTARIDDDIGLPENSLCLVNRNIAIARGAVYDSLGIESLRYAAAHKPVSSNNRD